MGQVPSYVNLSPDFHTHLSGEGPPVTCLTAAVQAPGARPGACWVSLCVQVRASFKVHTAL